MKGPLCAHQLEGCTVWPIFTTHTTHTHTHTRSICGHTEAQRQIARAKRKRRLTDYVFDVLVAGHPVGHCDVENMLL